MHEETRKLIEQQIKLLSDRSKKTEFIDELIQLSLAMAQLTEVLKDL